MLPVVVLVLGVLLVGPAFAGLVVTRLRGR